MEDVNKMFEIPNQILDPIIQVKPKENTLR